MNSIVIPAKRMCTRCDCENALDAKNCKGCGATFCFGLPDRSSDSYIEQLKKQARDCDNMFRVQYLGDFSHDG